MISVPKEFKTQSKDCRKDAETIQEYDNNSIIEQKSTNTLSFGDMEFNVVIDENLEEDEFALMTNTSVMKNTWKKPAQFTEHFNINKPYTLTEHENYIEVKNT